MVSPNRRTWSLAGLARDRDYRLWFCERERRWEVEHLVHDDIEHLVLDGVTWPAWSTAGQDETEPALPTEWPGSRPDGPQRSEDRPDGIPPTDRRTAPLARPAWLPPL
jgi:hypothetical protein